MRLVLKFFILLSILFGTSSLATSAGKKALVGGRLIDGFGHRPTANSVILIDGNIISAVGTVGSLAIPEGYEVISTEGMDVLPGLWESHAHLMLTGHSDYAHWDKTYVGRLASEIMPASAVQLLLAGVTATRDLGAPLADTVAVKAAIESGTIPVPRLFASGPFLQAEVPPGTEKFRWAVTSVAEANARVNQLADAGMEIIKLIDQDKMSLEVAQAIVTQAHARGMKVVAHSHRPGEIRRGLEIGVDNFEHTGLTTAPAYPRDIVEKLRERTATGRIAGGPLFWTPTVEGLSNYPLTVDNPEKLDNSCWRRGLKADTIADVKASIQKPGEMAYSSLVPLRRPTLKKKIRQLRKAGVVFLVGTDSGIPMKFHCQSTWNEMAAWVDTFDIPVMDTIRGATFWPAVMMGVGDKLGTVSAGKYADIIAVKGDVLRYINLLQNVELVMKDGTLYKENGVPVEENLKAR